MKAQTALLTVWCIALASCDKPQPPGPMEMALSLKSTTPEPLALILAPHTGEGRLDKQIRQAQEQIRTRHAASPSLEQLGWLYVAKARESFDPGYYKLAEQCAVCLESRQKQVPEALFLRGYVLNNLHQFKEAEALASELVAERGLSVDFGLLGDALMEQGKLDRAADAYQQMANLKPDLHAFVRAAHLRWLKGDLAGATELAADAARSVNSRDQDTAAWVLTRLAAYQFQAGSSQAARASCEEALALRPEYPPALLWSGRMLLAEGDAVEAVKLLRRAADLVPLPEYQWALTEALGVSGDHAGARAVETELLRTGATADPRTLALFLATRAESKDLAVKLATEELENRQDVFTQDALAWALTSAGRLGEARTHEAKALVEETQDARLFFHAAVLADRAADSIAASKWTAKASELATLLLPSERAQLAQLAARYFPHQSMGLAGVEK